VPFSISLRQVVLISACLFAYYFTDPDERHIFSLFVVAIGVCLVFLLVSLIPVDVFIVSASVNPTTGEQLVHPVLLAKEQTVVQFLYVGIYLALIVYIFTLAPFSYFFYEEDADIDVPLSKKMLNAAKYTVVFLIVLIILFVIALVIASPSAKTSDNTGRTDWVNKVIDTQNYGSRVLTFLISCVVIIAFVPYLSYCCYGWAAMCVNFLRAPRALDDERSAVQNEVESRRSRIEALRAKAASKGRVLKGREKKTYEKLQQEEGRWRKVSDKLDAYTTGWGRILMIIKQSAFVLSIVGCIFVVVIILSFLFTALDRLVNSPCGFSCSFTVNAPLILSPLDLIFSYAAWIFPLDLTFCMLLSLMFCVAAWTAIYIWGIRFAWIKLWDVRFGLATPQALLVSTAILMCTVMVLVAYFPILAPQWISWGTQHYATTKSPAVTMLAPQFTMEALQGNKTVTMNVLPCTLSAPQTANCTLTVIGSFTSSLNWNMPLVGVGILGSVFVCILAILAFIVVAITVRTTDLKDRLESALRDEDSDDDF
jgi:LMBR1 domain-containing protein 1